MGYRVAINGFVYDVSAVDAGECGTSAFELHKLDTNHTYHVIRTHHGAVECDCPDYEARHRGNGFVPLTC